ncbi:MAG TPA: hypothetical protein VG940_07950 [Gemmatimonadales bacterium]|nr:hypothetical protein [Gemmatimonadales bacterium]
MRRLLVLLACVATSLDAQKSGTTAAAAPADPFVGSFVNDDQETVTIQKQGSTYSGAIGANGTSYPFSARKMGRSLVGTLSAQGQSVLVQFTVSGDVLSFSVNGQTTQLRRGRPSAARAGRTPAEANAGRPETAPRPASGQDAQIERILLSSPWCYMRYSQTLGSTNTERGVFYRDGRLVVGTGHEMVSSGANGTVYGSGSGGAEYRWRVQNGDLWLSEAGGPFNPTGLRITQNSNGYPILNVDGKEYSQCN